MRAPVVPAPVADDATVKLQRVSYMPSQFRTPDGKWEATNCKATDGKWELQSVSARWGWRVRATVRTLDEVREFIASHHP